MARLPASAPPETLLGVARVYADARLPDKMIDPLTRYLRQRPDDWQAWLDLATLYALSHDTARGQAAVRKALELGREKAFAEIEANDSLRALALPMLRERRLAPPAGADLGLR